MKVIITGSSGGIGIASVRLFLSEGAQVHGIDQVPFPKEGLKGLEQFDGNFSFTVADLSCENQNIAAMQKSVDALGQRVDTLILNHGVGANLDHVEGRPIVCHTALDWDSADFNRVMVANFESAVWSVREIIAHMPKNDGSAIISSSSVWTRGRLHYALPYASSKSALSVAARNWATQFAPIRSVGVVLGAIDTPMLTTNPKGKKEASEGTLLRRVGSPEEVAKTYHFIAMCRYITGTEIVLDGGMLHKQW